MSDLISRQAAIDAIRKSASKYTGFMEMEMYTDNDAVEAINGVPSAYPKKGMWTKIRLTDKDYGARAKECSSCGSTFFNTIRWHYCPNCGADMRGETNE